MSRIVSRAIAVSFAILEVGSHASAASVELKLKVAGSVARAPEWQDANGNKIIDRTFVFSGLGGDARRDVDSEPVTYKLVNAKDGVYPVTITVNTPSNCKIGETDVLPAHVKLVRGSDVIGNGGSFQIDASAQESKLRFDAAGDYGDKTGLVVCGVDGALTYGF